MRVDSGYFLEATTSSSSVGGTVSAGLPNISGAITNIGAQVEGESVTASGAISISGNQSSWTGHPSGTGYYLTSIKFNASSSNSVYGKSTTVQPKSRTVYMYRRTA